MIESKYILETEIRKWIEDLVQDIRKELTDQGHRATGKLIDGIEIEIEKSKDFLVAKILMEHYSRFLDTGFKPKFSIPGKAARSSYIDALIKWLDVKNIGSVRERKGIAFAIAKTAVKTGHPTPGSYKYSMNNRRKNWAKHTIEPKVLTLPESLNLESFIVNLFGRALMTVE